MSTIRKGTDEGKVFEQDLTAVEEDFEERDSQNDFIESIRSFWDKNEFVTEKQAAAVDKFVERIGADYSGWPG